MPSREYLLYHFGWVIGVLMLVYGAGSVVWTLGGPGELALSRWHFLTWIALFQAVLGVAWLLSWYFVDRHRVADALGD